MERSCKSFSNERWYNALLDNVSHKIYNCSYSDLSLSQRNHIVQIVSDRIQVYYYMAPKVKITNRLVQQETCSDALVHIQNDSSMLMFEKEYDQLESNHKHVVDNYMEELLDAIFSDFDED